MRKIFRELLAVQIVAIENDLLMTRERLANGFGVDVGIAVHIPTYPGTKTNEFRHFVRLCFGSVNLFQRSFHFFVEHRDDLEQDLRQKIQHVLALIGHRQTFARILRGLPIGSNFPANALPNHARLGCRTRQPQPAKQQLGNALLFAQNGAACGFGRVGGQHRLDGQLQQQLADIRQAQTFGLQAIDRVFDPTGLWCGAIVQILPAAANAMDFLRRIDDLEPRRKGANQIASRLRRQIGARRRQRRRLDRTTLPARNGCLPVSLDHFEERIPGLLTDNLAHQDAQHMHVLAQSGIFERKENSLARHGKVRNWSLGTTGRIEIGEMQPMLEDARAEVI